MPPRNASIAENGWELNGWFGKRLHRRILSNPILLNLCMSSNLKLTKFKAARFFSLTPR